MKNRIEFVYDNSDKDLRTSVGYVRLLIAIFGGNCHIIVKKHHKHHLSSPSTASRKSK